MIQESPSHTSRDPWTCSNTSFHFINIENTSCYILQRVHCFVHSLFSSALPQPSTLSLKARHTTAFWWPLYSLLISPVSTHHRRARLSDEAVGGKPSKSHICYRSHWRDQNLIKQRIMFQLFQCNTILFTTDLHCLLLTSDNILRVPRESTVPHPASRCLSRIVALDA